MPASSMPREPDSPPATIRQLMKTTKWVWAHCRYHLCGHSQPVALAPLAIRWGLDASSELIQKNLVCAVCGRRGAILHGPSWGDIQIGEQPFPVECLGRAPVESEELSFEEFYSSVLEACRRNGRLTVDRVDARKSWENMKSGYTTGLQIGDEILWFKDFRKHG